MIAATPLVDLGTLVPELLYVFVAGPGTGEGIAIALPHRGWLAIDGCDLRGARGATLVPVMQIMERWRRGPDDGLEGYVWTHAHEDHAGGVARLLDRFPPQWIGLAGAEADARAALGLLRSEASGAGGVDLLRRRKAVQTAIAIEDWVARTRRPPSEMLAGTTRPVAGGRVELSVHAPGEPVVRRVLDRWRNGPARLARLNEASIVFGLTYGRTKLVLGGDLPWRETGADPPRSVPGGWDDVIASSPTLHAHQLLKVPHHGSKWALHPDLMPAGPLGRAWLVTPFSAQGLPRTATDEGLTSLVACEERVMLSALPIAAERQPGFAHPATVQVGALDALMRTPPGGDVTGGGAAAILAPGVRSFHDPVWCVALDDTATVRGRWRGDVACEVVA